MEAIKEMEDSQKEDRVEILLRMDSIDKALRGIVKKLRSIQVSQELRDEKENKLDSKNGKVNLTVHNGVHVT